MEINVGPKQVGGRATFIIAEIGNNHNGDFERAIQMVDRAVSAGADCVKFQMRHLNKVYRHRSLDKESEDLGTEYILDLLDRFELTVEQHRLIADYCASLDVLYLCTPWDTLSVEVLEDFDVPAYKVASADLTNVELLNALVKTNKPLILSTGMSLPSEVEFTVNMLNRHKTDFVLLHCNSTYPAPFHDINLKWMERLRELHPLVGYSGHERGIAVSIGAVAIGACIVERHFTLDRKMEGPDHAASLEPLEFEKLVAGIRELEQAMGSGQDRRLSQGEMINRENLAKSLVASRKIKAGTVITYGDVKVASPGQGMSPQRLDELIGCSLRRDLEEEDFFFDSDIDEEIVMPGTYGFDLSWGIPVRYHDFELYNSKIDPDLFEFHLSFADIEINPNDYLTGPYDCGFVVHAPELFADSHLLDLASPDLEYRKHSIEQMQRVVDLTNGLKAFFPNTERPLIVTNVGGFTMDAPLKPEVVDEYYELFGESLESLDAAGVEIIPQTMAPFPWHFGGQRYQNLFVNCDEITKWCKALDLRMCFDVSHSKLASNYFGFDFDLFAEKIAPITAHIHLGDASGWNGEGLQIGEGEIDFETLCACLLKNCPQASFIPEIWQGHKNSGEGFWQALTALNGKL